MNLTKDDGVTPLVQTHKFVPICRKCQKISDPKIRNKCTHVKGADPPFKSVSQRRKWEEINKKLGKENITNVEFYGVENEETGKAFYDMTIDWMCNKKNFYNELKQFINLTTIPYIGMYIDPSGGGKSCSAATIAYKNLRSKKTVVS